MVLHPSIPPVPPPQPPPPPPPVQPWGIGGLEKTVDVFKGKFP